MAQEDPIDLRLEEFYNGTGSAIPFQRTGDVHSIQNRVIAAGRILFSIFSQDQSWFLSVRGDNSGARHHQPQAHGKNRSAISQGALVSVVNCPFVLSSSHSTWCFFFFFSPPVLVRLSIQYA